MQCERLDILQGLEAPGNLTVLILRSPSQAGAACHKQKAMIFQHRAENYAVVQVVTLLNSASA